MPTLYIATIKDKYFFQKRAQRDLIVPIVSSQVTGTFPYVAVWDYKSPYCGWRNVEISRILSIKNHNCAEKELSENSLSFMASAGYCYYDESERKRLRDKLGTHLSFLARKGDLSLLLFQNDATESLMDLAQTAVKREGASFVNLTP